MTGPAADGYAGDVSPREAYDIVEQDPEAVLVDVRTVAEWTYVGTPDLTDAAGRLLTIEWNHAGGNRNEEFLDELDEAAVDKSAPVLFLCRSGARSQAAAVAATQAGYDAAHNVAGGFEGDLDASRHRGTRSGWKADGLPWRQT